ncbi:MAG TPA: VOC family protein [Thermoanaerobaculia bacterium]|jgi:PhnB protein|nr:VOC family protein [Thermoanaerobaculia bacterium]
MSIQVIPYLHVKGAARAIEFYVRAFGAKEVVRLSEPGGRIGHAEIQIGDARIMLADEFPEHGIRGPQSLGGTSVGIHLTVPDVDAVAEQAVAAGASLSKPIQDEFYGERGGKLEDPFGHTWHLVTRIEDVSPEEMQRRYEVLMAGGEE